MYSIIKEFKDYPFAHRQHKHNGHCAFIHGHNWNFKICLECKERDENGFVYDFGKFKEFKQWLKDTFDHTCLINKDDPERALFEELKARGMIDIRYVENGSSEGLAKMIYETMKDYISKEDLKRGVQIAFVMVQEDENNTAIYGKQ